MLKVVNTNRGDLYYVLHIYCRELLTLNQIFTLTNTWIAHYMLDFIGGYR